MDDLSVLGTKVGFIGQAAKEQAVLLQAMSWQARQMAQQIDSYIHGTTGNEATEICDALHSAGNEAMIACHALMQAWQSSQQWLTYHVPRAAAPMAPLGGTAASDVPAGTNPVSINPVGSLYESSPPKSALESADESTMQGYTKIACSHLPLDDLKNTNPNWAEDSPWDVNCQRCVSAYEARRRGFNVTAAPLLDDRDPLQIMRHPLGWPSVYQDAELVNCSSRSGTGSEILVDEKMAEWGDGARAIVRVRWKMGGGHVFIAERVNGRTKYSDPQRGSENVGYYFQSAKGKGTYCVRIDNLPFTDRIHDCITKEAP